ncbi:hypothetical protein [Bradyrhizobium sp. UFLA05-112]
MGRHQHIIDEFGRMESICRHLADGSTMLEERTALLIMANNYGAAILEARAGNAFAGTVQTRGFFGRLALRLKSLIEQPET